MRFVLGLLLGAVIGFGAAVWFQGEPPFAGTASSKGSDITLILSDSFLTRQAAPSIISQSGGAVSNIKITSSNGDIAYVEARGTVAGTTVPVGVSFAPRAAAGSIVL